MLTTSGRADVRTGDAICDVGGESTAGGMRGRRRASIGANGDTAVGGSDSHRTLIDALVTSRIYQDYERAFTEATGLPVALRPVESWQLPHHGKRGESPFCAMVAERSRACGSCLEVQEKL